MNKNIKPEIAIGIILIVAAIIGGSIWINSKKIVFGPGGMPAQNEMQTPNRSGQQTQDRNISIDGLILASEQNEMQTPNSSGQQTQDRNISIDGLILASEPKDIVQQFKDVFFNSSENTNTQIGEALCFSWIRKDGIDFGPQGAWEVRSSRSNRNSVEQDITKMSDLLIRNGFSKSAKNYENLEKDFYINIPGERIGFEKGELKCNISWSENSVPDGDSGKEHFSVSCVKITPESEQDFKNIYSALRSYNLLKVYAETFCITKKNENFAMGLVGKISAPVWYAKKENGKWIVTTVTQDYPLCDNVNGFPEDYYGNECYYNDENGELQLRE